MKQELDNISEVMNQILTIKRYLNDFYRYHNNHEGLGRSVFCRDIENLYRKIDIGRRALDDMVYDYHQEVRNAANH